MESVQKNTQEQGIKSAIAHIISIILIPLFAPTYLFYIILFYFPTLTPISDISQKIWSVLYIFIATTLPPFIVIFILYKMKKISSITLHEKSDRVIPQIFSCFNYVLITFVLGYKLGHRNPLTLSMIAISLSMIAISIITYFWKISAHSAGATGILSIASFLYMDTSSVNFFVPYNILFTLTILVCLARLQLKVHTISQVIAGCLLGGIIGFSCFYFLK